MRVFLSFHSPDRECALALKAAIEQAQPGSEVFVDQTGLRYGHLWQPALFDAIAKSTAFIILVSNQLGDWQKVEYYEARDRKAKDDDYLLLPIIVADKRKGPAANLPGLALLHWIETTEPAAPEPLSRIVAALSSKAVPKPPEPWRIVNPYRGLLADRVWLLFPAKLYCGQSVLDTRRESVIVDYHFADDIEGYRARPDSLAGRGGLRIRDEFRMVRPGFYLGRAYANRIAERVAQAFESGGALAEGCWPASEQIRRASR
jgi:hypothetical protein